MSKFSAKTNMISQQIRTWGINNQRILDAFDETPREKFVPERYKESAYSDYNIPLEFDQQMMTPMVEAKILDALNLQKNENVLEIGTGSGFLTALIAKLSMNLVSIDIHSAFITQAKHKLKSLGIFNVKLKNTDAVSLMKKNKTTYDAIVITGSISELAQEFYQSLNIGGRIFAIIGQPNDNIMQATLITRASESEFKKEVIFETVIAPLEAIEQPETFTF